MSIVYLRIRFLSDLEHALQVTTFEFVIGPREKPIPYLFFYLLIAFLDRTVSMLKMPYLVIRRPVLRIWICMDFACPSNFFCCTNFLPFSFDSCIINKLKSVVSHITPFSGQTIVWLAHLWRFVCGGRPFSWSRGKTVYNVKENKRLWPEKSVPVVRWRFTYRLYWRNSSQGCGSGSAKLDPDPHSHLGWKARSGSALKSKFRSFRGSNGAVDAHNRGVESQNGALEGL